MRAREKGEARRIVRAEGFELVDSRGRTRAALVVDPDGTATLAFVDRGGKFRAMLGVDADGIPTLILGDKDGNIRAGITVSADKTAGVNLCDENGEPCATLTVAADGTPALTFFDSDGKPSLTVHPTGKQGLTVPPAPPTPIYVFLPGAGLAGPATLGSCSRWASPRSR